MSDLVFLLEEESVRELLKGLLPRIIPEEIRETINIRYICFEGKQDLDRNITPKIRSYRNPASSFIILRDQDSADCHILKDDLRSKCTIANRPDSVIRIACREIESWYLADLLAVERGLNINGLSQHQNKRKYRAPDYLHKPSKDLKILTNNIYQKVSGSRSIGPFLQLDNCRSNSFKVFVDGIRQVTNIN